MRAPPSREMSGRKGAVARCPSALSLGKGMQAHQTWVFVLGGQEHTVPSSLRKAKNRQGFTANRTDAITTAEGRRAMVACPGWT